MCSGVYRPRVALTELVITQMIQRNSTLAVTQLNCLDSLRFALIS